MVEAVVVGAGPNGLAAAVTLAQAGVSVRVLEAADTVGGGSRTQALIEPDVLHDICSGVHPLAVASPFLSSLPLVDHGLTWAHADTPLAHPLEGRTAVIERDLDATAMRLGEDGASWKREVGGLAERWDATLDLALKPPIRTIRHPIRGAKFAFHALRSAQSLTRKFKGEDARALLAGNAAHSISKLDASATAGVGALLAASAHAVGWPVAVGGSQAIADSLLSYLGSLGGEVETGVRVDRWSDIPDSKLVLFDTSPGAAARIAGDRMPSRIRSTYKRFRHGSGSFKLDLILDGPIPWADPEARRAGTLHIGGTFEEIATAEGQVASGNHPTAPFVLVSQPRLADPSRSPEGRHPIWAYTHVPARSTVDMTEPVLSQIERFAPGFRDRIVATLARGPAELEHENPNYVGGDIAGGAISLWRLLRRPRLFNPYRAGPGLYLCSASTPPGAGVHGMCGHLAAEAALKDLG